ncbi:hypothetical protein [Hyphomonas sp. ND6WE1B]|uniref:hypothetical protein n=1 Tax=Hyphomonas sp. ND6WE1B TaxID=1848191 RepID=UPI0008076B44|nr:hypothetical protein [Hyphomonas sp. ND6WE1B]
MRVPTYLPGTILALAIGAGLGSCTKQAGKVPDGDTYEVLETPRNGDPSKAARRSLDPPFAAGQYSNQAKIDKWFEVFDPEDWTTPERASDEQVSAAIGCMAGERVQRYVSSFVKDQAQDFSRANVRAARLPDGDVVAIVESDPVPNGRASQYRVVLVLQDCLPIDFMTPFAPLAVRFTIEGTEQPELGSLDTQVVFEAKARNTSPVWPLLFVHAKENKLAVLRFYSPGHLDGTLGLRDEQDAECKAALANLYEADLVEGQDGDAIRQLPRVPSSACFRTTSLFTPDSLNLVMKLIEPVHGIGTDARKVLDTRTVDGQIQVVSAFKVEQPLLGSAPAEMKPGYTFQLEQFSSIPPG